MKKILITFTMISVAVIALYVIQRIWPLTAAVLPQPGNLPWQIEHVNGTTRVFNLTLGESRLGDAAKIIGSDYELAILAKPGQPEALELYSGNFRTGNLTGSIIVVADVSAADMQQLRSSVPVVQEHLETGTKKTTLRFEQQNAAFAYSIKSITFIPVADITADLLVQRFGQPGQVLKTAEKVTHFMYPQSGLSVIVNDSGRDFLQYVAPSAFSAVQHDTSLQAEKFAQETVGEKHGQ
jgi:hypothetical protein